MFCYTSTATGLDRRSKHSRYGDNLCGERFNDVRLYNARQFFRVDTSETKSKIISISIDSTLDIVESMNLTEKSALIVERKRLGI